jgi:hypothetical protein
VHHGPQIIHALFEAGEATDAVGEAGATLVEEDEPGKRCKPPEEACDDRIILEAFDVGDEAWYEDKVEGAATDQLIGDA